MVGGREATALILEEISNHEVENKGEEAGRKRRRTKRERGGRIVKGIDQEDEESGPGVRVEKGQ
jgi:hypothetical protein